MLFVSLFFFFLETNKRFIAKRETRKPILFECANFSYIVLLPLQQFSAFEKKKFSLNNVIAKRGLKGLGHLPSKWPD